MLRAALLVTCLAACGRLEFGVLGATDSGTGDVAPSPDAQPAACAIEGSPCDDLDICTTSSTCMSGICVGPAHAPCEVANFQDEYSDTQGEGGWVYGAWNRTLDIDGYSPGADFEAFAFFAVDGAWHPQAYEETGPNFTWAYIHWWGGHPAELPERRFPIRRWVSDVVGHANLVVHFAKADIGGGDGVGCLVYIEGNKALDREIAFDDNVGFTETIPVELDIGTRLDVMMTYRLDEGTDTSDMQITVVSR